MSIHTINTTLVEGEALILERGQQESNVHLDHQYNRGNHSYRGNHLDYLVLRRDLAMDHSPHKRFLVQYRHESTKNKKNKKKKKKKEKSPLLGKDNQYLPLIDQDQ